MKLASDFRRIAREALFGNWRVAILTGFVATLIGANICSNGGSSSSPDRDSNRLLSHDTIEKILPIIFIILAIIAIWAIGTIIIGGAGKLGYAKFNLNLVDGKQGKFSDLFSQFDRLDDGFVMNFLIGLFTFLWSLLFVIPGIVKMYSYAMTPYILSENPEMAPIDAITESKNMMQGNKWRLFCLDFSFIGWELLRVTPLLILSPFIFIGEIGIILWVVLSLVAVFVAGLFVKPYEEAARAAFYRDISGTEIKPDEETENVYNN